MNKNLNPSQFLRRKMGQDWDLKLAGAALAVTTAVGSAGIVTSGVHEHHQEQQHSVVQQHGNEVPGMPAGWSPVQGR